MGTDHFMRWYRNTIKAQTHLVGYELFVYIQVSACENLKKLIVWILG